MNVDEKTDIASVRREIKADYRVFQTEIEAKYRSLREEARADRDSLRREVSTEVQSQMAEAEHRRDMKRISRTSEMWVIAMLLGLYLIAIGSIVVAVVRSAHH